jgi:hypothetical protein
MPLLVALYFFEVERGSREKIEVRTIFGIAYNAPIQDLLAHAPIF